MTKKDYLLTASAVNCLLNRFCLFKYRFNIMDGALWDLITLYYCTLSGRAIVTKTTLNEFRYGLRTGLKAIAERLDTLKDRGLVNSTTKGFFLTDQGMKEMKILLSINEEDIIDIKLPAVVKSLRTTKYTGRDKRVRKPKTTPKTT